jgi:succinate dehydrogenase / fumarate reductase cytochrome b subunit
MSKKAATANNRPLSPHLSIYKPQITSVLSITHRGTGVFLFLGILLLNWWLVTSVYSDTGFWSVFATPVGYIFLGFWSFSLFYHLLNGIRHLFWDMGKGFELKCVTKPGIAVVVGSVLLTALSWVIAFKDMM